MKNQVLDEMIFEKQRYAIVGIEFEKKFFTPQMFGFTILEHESVARRGFLAEYTVMDDQLYLKSLLISTKDDILLNNTRARQLSAKEQSKVARNMQKIVPMVNCISLNKLYLEVMMPLNYTGKLLLGSDFHGDVENNGFQSPFNFKQGILLEFVDGITYVESNISDKLEFYRTHLSDSQLDNKNERSYLPIFNLFVDNLYEERLRVVIKKLLSEMSKKDKDELLASKDDGFKQYLFSFEIQKKCSSFIEDTYFDSENFAWDVTQKLIEYLLEFKEYNQPQQPF